MKIIGITGGVGAGKTEVMTYIGQHYDAAVIKADEVGYLLMEPGKDCYAPIVCLFGRQITDEAGNLNRKRIAELIFGDQEKLQQMNKIVHPAVKTYIRRAIAEEEKAGTPFVFIEAALLIEDHYDEICDELWYIYAAERVRRERLRNDRKYTDERIDGIMENQLSEEEFSEHCDFEVDNSGEFEDTIKQIDRRMSKYESELPDLL